MEYVVDVQGFKVPVNKFILKELVILPLNEHVPQPYSFLFQPPCNWMEIPPKYKRINRWLDFNCHCLQWSYGQIPYKLSSVILESLFDGAKTIYVKGLQKKRWLENFVKKSTDVIDMDSMKCPTLLKLQEKNCNLTPCQYHCRTRGLELKFINCAERNVNLLTSWLRADVKEEKKNVKIVTKLVA